MADTFTAFGGTFRWAPEVNEYAMLRFARAAQTSGTDELGGLAAVMDVLESVVHPDDWPDFDRAALRARANIERDLMPLVVEAFTRQAGRPTQQPSDSSDGLRVIKATSEGGSSSPATSPADRLVSKGRTDLAEFVWLAEEARSTG